MLNTSGLIIILAFVVKLQQVFSLYADIHILIVLNKNHIAPLPLLVLIIASVWEEACYRI